MTSRITVAIAAALAAGGLAIATARAQDTAAAPSAHARAHGGQGAASTSTREMKSQASYSLGLLLGSTLPQLGLNANNLDLPSVVGGLKDVLGGKVRPSPADQQKVQQLVQQSHGAAGAQANAKDPAVGHSLGLMLGARLPQLGLSEQSLAFSRVEQGLKDALSGKVHASKDDQQKVQDLILASRREVGEKNEAAAQRFLAANSKRAGVKTTASGLQYKVLNPGSGTSPQAKDQVTLNYRGSLLDGTVFDSTYERGMPFTFAFNVDHVIPGWEEAVGMMKPGAKWQLFIPPQLAYGANSPPPIPPNSLLEFDVELLKVAPPSASPSGAGPNVGGGTPH